jgi:hypothetical protein
MASKRLHVDVAAKKSGRCFAKDKSSELYNCCFWWLLLLLMWRLEAEDMVVM